MATTPSCALSNLSAASARGRCRSRALALFPACDDRARRGPVPGRGGLCAVCELAPGATVDEFAAELRVIDGPDVTAAVAAEEATPFDLVNEYPIRMTLLRRDGALTHLVTTLSHLYADAGAGFAMFTDRVSGATGPVRTQLLDLAAAQRTPAARRQSDAALAYWANHLRSLPTRRFRAADPADTDHVTRAEIAALIDDMRATVAAAVLDGDAKTLL